MLSYEGRKIKSGEATFWIMLNHATADNVAPPDHAAYVSGGPIEGGRRKIKSGEARFWNMVDHAAADNGIPPPDHFVDIGEVLWGGPMGRSYQGRSYLIGPL